MGNQQPKSGSRKCHSAPTSARGSSSSRKSKSEPLTPFQKVALKETWNKMTKTGRNGFGTVSFRKTMEDPKVKTMCRHVDVIEGAFSFGLTGASSQFQEHSILVNQLVDLAICNLENLYESRFVKECEEIGAKHYQYNVYGFKSEFWDIFGNCIMETAMTHCRGKCVLEKRRAWAILASIIADRLRAGYESSVRRKSLETTGPAAQSRVPKKPSIEDSLSVIAEVPSRRPSAVPADEQDRRSADTAESCIRVGTAPLPDLVQTGPRSSISYSSSGSALAIEAMGPGKTGGPPTQQLHRQEYPSTESGTFDSQMSYEGPGYSQPFTRRTEQLQQLSESDSCADGEYADTVIQQTRHGSFEAQDSISCGERTPDLRRKALRRISLRGLERANRFRQKAAFNRRGTTAGILDTLPSTDTGSSFSTTQLLNSTDQSFCHSSSSRDLKD